MTHYAFQTDKKLEDIEKDMESIGVSGLLDFDRSKPGMYIVSVEPFNLSKTLDNFSIEELEEEIENRKREW